MAIKHKLNSEFNSEIERLNKELPRMAKFDRNGYPVYRRQVMDGLDINMTGERDRDGNKFAEGVKYTIPVLQYVNHKEVMLEIFKQDGIDGVREYAKEVRDKKESMDKEARNIRKQQHSISARLVKFFAPLFGTKKVK